MLINWHEMEPKKMGRATRSGSSTQNGRVLWLEPEGLLKSPPHFFAEIVGQENDGAIAGRLPSEEEQARIFKEFLETDFVVDQLEKVRAHKEKLLKKLESAGE